MFVCDEQYGHGAEYFGSGASMNELETIPVDFMRSIPKWGIETTIGYFWGDQSMKIAELTTCYLAPLRETIVVRV